MCGADPSQTNLEEKQASFYDQATNEATQAYKEDQGLLQEITSVYSPILAKGPSQEGFSAGELADLNAQSVEGTARNYSAAARAVNENLAAESGGDIPLTSGGAAQLKSEVAQASAQAQSEQESQIKEADYSQGYQEFVQAGNAISTASGQLSPTAYTSAATGAGSAASETANEIAEENNSWINAAIGAAGAIGGGLAGGFAKGGFKNPFSGGGGTVPQNV